MLKEFKLFIMKGNVIDLAVAVIIGGAFGKIVTSLVNDVIMPIIGILIGNVDFKSLKILITPAAGETPEVAVYYGMFIQNIVDFLIIALCIFIMIKMVEKFKRKPEIVTKETVETIPEEIQLLTEIRDLLKK
jgi:large conductance mechanosensitive channel